MSQFAAFCKEGDILQKDAETQIQMVQVAASGESG
jgi:hypothetical protein